MIYQLMVPIIWHGCEFLVIWSDIDYMDKANPFTIDTTNYNPDQFRDFLNETGIHWVPIIEPFLGLNSTPWKAAHALDILLKNADGGEFLGKG